MKEEENSKIWKIKTLSVEWTERKKKMGSIYEDFFWNILFITVYLWLYRGYSFLNKYLQ